MMMLTLTPVGLHVAFMLWSTVIPAHASGTEGPQCLSHVYLKVGEKGKIPCLCRNFTIISWYVEEEFDGGGFPVINYNGVQKKGYGYSAEEYDIEQNGTLIIHSVRRHHEGCFVVTVVDDNEHREDTIRIQVTVVVPASPIYPVANGKTSQQHVYMDINRNGTLRCTMFGVYPDINLTWISPGGQVSFQHERAITTPGPNNTFDVTLTTHYSVVDLSVKRVTIYCKVNGSEIAKQFPDKTRVDLLLFPVYPVVNGHVNQKHVYIDADREGQLTCFKENVDDGTILTWQVVDPTMQGKIALTLSEPVISSNNGDAVKYNQTVHYIADYSVDRILIECREMELTTNKYHFGTKVDLLFENVYPVVNGLVSQNHVYLDVDRGGHITCLKESVEPGTTLVWEIHKPNMQDKITFQSNPVISNNNDGTININQTFIYQVHGHSLERITIECKIVEPDTDEHPFVTKVELLFQNVYPVVNGLVNQNHVYLDVDREGHITCLKESVNPGTTLVWEIPEPDMQGKISFQSNPVISNNNDGTININQTFYYQVHDHSLERITIGCKIVEPDTNEHPFVTKVELLFQNVYPVVNGLVSQNHVYLDVDREGHITCLKESVDPGTTLAWEIPQANMKDKITFQDNPVISKNNDGTVNINQTFHYQVHDHSLERITIECKIVEPDTNEHPFVTKVELLFQNVYPVVNGLVCQNHVYLDVDREGHITCLKESVEPGTTLVWEIPEPNMQDKITFQSNPVISNNNDGTININQTFAYFVRDKMIERITVECRVIGPDTDEHPFVTKVELLLGCGDGSVSSSSHGTVVGLSFTTTALVIVLMLIVILLWIYIRKIYKKSKMKYLDIVGCRHNDQGYSLPEDPQRNGSSETPDSGKSGSLSSQQSRSEPSEKCALMEEGIEMSIGNIGRQATSEDKQEYPKVPIV